MRKIKLTQKKYALVDDEDFEKLNAIKWFFNDGYAKAYYNGKHILMHRFLLNISQRNIFIDHIDMNRSNNQKKNLRICTCSQNFQNKTVTSANRTGVKGVRWNKYDNRFTAQIGINRKNIYIGNFKTLKEAKIAYNKKAIELFGNFAYLNK